MSGCDSISNTTTTFNCSKLSTTDKKLMNESIVSQMNSLKSSFEKIGDSSYNPSVRGASISKIIDTIHFNTKKEYCEVIITNHNI
jgi:hypothetical protein